MDEKGSLTFDFNENENTPPGVEQRLFGNRIETQWGEIKLNILVCPHCGKNPVTCVLARWRSDGNSIEQIQDSDWYCSQDEDCKQKSKVQEDPSGGVIKYPIKPSTLDLPEFNGKNKSTKKRLIEDFGKVLGVDDPTEKKIKDLFPKKERTEPAPGVWGDLGWRYKR